MKLKELPVKASTSPTLLAATAAAAMWKAGSNLTAQSFPSVKESCLSKSRRHHGCPWVHTYMYTVYLWKLWNAYIEIYIIILIIKHLLVNVVLMSILNLDLETASFQPPTSGQRGCSDQPSTFLLHCCSMQLAFQTSMKLSLQKSCRINGSQPIKLRLVFNVCGFLLLWQAVWTVGYAALPKISYAHLKRRQNIAHVTSCDYVTGSHPSGW